jgi:23S rRNA (uracil1939-C5)-methyltransferase
VGERVRLRTGAMVHGGACLARPDGEPDAPAILVAGALPGELVTVELSGRRRGVTRGRAIEVLEASPDRIEAPCPYYGVCGGCDMQHIAYERQLALKREVVVDAMRRQRVDLPEGELPVHGMRDPWRYRWRGEFHSVRERAGGGVTGDPGPGAILGLGFNRARSWTPVAVDDCLIHHRAITDALPALAALAQRSGTERLTALHLTAGEQGAELLVSPRPREAIPAAALDGAALAHGGGVRWVTGGTTLRWGELAARVEAQSFIQVNQEQMGVLYDRALAALGDPRGARVVDAYAGIGLLSCAVARAGASVVCIEENRWAARLGMLNARLNGVEGRVRYIPRRVEDALAEAGDVDALLLDPPRAGCAGSVTGRLALAGPARIVYVSCDPATLARDLHLLVASGPYTLESLELVDMFPQTHHIESVAALYRE